MDNNYVYPAKLKIDNGEYIIEFIDFPNLIAVSDNKDEIINEAQTVLALAILNYVDSGKILPKPSTMEEGAVYIHIWLPYYRNTAKEIYVKKTVTIPQWLDILAKERNINFSACMVRGIKEELGIK